MSLVAADGKYTTEFIEYLKLQGTENRKENQARRGIDLDRARVVAGLKVAADAMKTYLEVIAGLNPGGSVVMGAEDIAQGRFLAGIVGILSVIPAEKLLALLEHLPTSGLIVRFVGGEGNRSRRGEE